MIRVRGGIAAALLVLGGCAAEDTPMGNGTVPGPSQAGTFASGAGFGASGAAGSDISTSGGGGVAGSVPLPAGSGPLPAGAAGSVIMTAGMGGTGESGTSGSGAAGMAGSTPTPTGPEPTLPPMPSSCPEFTDGATIAIGGHGGVLITAGPPGMGGPLVFNWHGTGGTASGAMRQMPAIMISEVKASGGIIAAFNGRDSSGAEGDCSGTGAHNMADFKAADEIVACAVANHGIDPRRIYTTGCSAGGLQSGCMAQQRSSYIAVSAPNSGGVVFPQPWQDDSTPAIFTMHGGSSDVVIVAFSDTSRTLDMSAKDHGSFVVNCNHGGGHCRAPGDLYEAAWQFMKDHPYGFGTSPWATSFPAGVPDYCEIF